MNASFGMNALMLRAECTHAAIWRLQVRMEAADAAAAEAAQKQVLAEQALAAAREAAAAELEVARQEVSNERHLREQAEAAREQMGVVLTARDRRIEAEMRAIADREMRATQVGGIRIRLLILAGGWDPYQGCGARCGVGGVLTHQPLHPVNLHLHLHLHLLPWAWAVVVCDT